MVELKLNAIMITEFTEDLTGHFWAENLNILIQRFKVLTLGLGTLVIGKVDGESMGILLLLVFLLQGGWMLSKFIVILQWRPNKCLVAKLVPNELDFSNLASKYASWQPY